MTDNSAPKKLDLKKFTFLRKPGRPKKVERKKHNWTDLSIEVRWLEYDKEGDPVEKYIIWHEDNIFMNFTVEGKKEFIQKVFYILGEQLDTDPSLAVELQERLEELYDIGLKHREDKK